MKAIRIKKMTIEEFKIEYNLEEKQGEGHFPCGYPVSELSTIIDSSDEEKTYILVEDKLYEEPGEVNSEVFVNHVSAQEAIEMLEGLNERFRDALISLREYLYHGMGAADSSRAKEIQLEMNQCINEAKVLLDRHAIKDRGQLKEMSKKYFMVEFLNSLFGDEGYSTEIEIDCGL